MSCGVGLFFAPRDFQGVLSFRWGGRVSCRSAFCAGVSRAGGAWCVPREAAGIPSDTPRGLCAEWRLHLRCVPLPAGATLAWGWPWRAGRAGAVVGTGPAPRPRYKYPSCRAAVFTRPQPGGGGSSPAGPGGGGDQATVQTLPSGQTGYGLTAPSRMGVWQRPLILGSQGPPATLWMSSLGFPESGRQRREASPQG